MAGTPVGCGVRMVYGDPWDPIEKLKPPLEHRYGARLLIFADSKLKRRGPPGGGRRPLKFSGKLGGDPYWVW